MPSSDALPPPARPPVCAMLMPILIGGCCAKTPEVCPSTAAAIVPPRKVLRFIDPPQYRFFGCFFWLLVVSPRSDFLLRLSRRKVRTKASPATSHNKAQAPSFGLSIYDA